MTGDAEQHLSVGDELPVRLPGSAAAGQAWIYDIDSGDERAVEVFERPQVIGADVSAAAVADTQFLLRAMHKGKVDVRFEPIELTGEVQPIRLRLKIG